MASCAGARHAGQRTSACSTGAHRRQFPLVPLGPRRVASALHEARAEPPPSCHDHLRSRLPSFVAAPLQRPHVDATRCYTSLHAAEMPALPRPRGLRVRGRHQVFDMSIQLNMRDQGRNRPTTPKASKYKSHFLCVASCGRHARLSGLSVAALARWTRIYANLARPATCNLASVTVFGGSARSHSRVYPSRYCSLRPTLSSQTTPNHHPSVKLPHMQAYEDG